MLKLASKLFVQLVILINRIRQSDMLNLHTRAYAGREKITTKSTELRVHRTQFFRSKWNNKPPGTNIRDSYLQETDSSHVLKLKHHSSAAGTVTRMNIHLWRPKAQRWNSILLASPMKHSAPVNEVTKHTPRRANPNRRPLQKKHSEKRHNSSLTTVRDDSSDSETAHYQSRDHDPFHC